MSRKRNIWRLKLPAPTVNNGLICAYCAQPTTLCDGRTIYPHRPDLWEKLFFRCVPCDAYVGSHPGTGHGLGRVANAELRLAKHAAHMAFDFLWEDKARRGNMGRNEARREAYKWLAEQMGVEPENCHIGMMDAALCRRTIEVCARELERLGRKPRPD